MKFKERILIRNIYFLGKTMLEFYRFQLFSMFKKLFWFFSQLNKLKEQGKNENFKHIEYFPCLWDNTENTPIDPTYFFQDTWAARKIFELKPNHHYDVGSAVKTVGILSQFVPTTMIDIRPIELELENLSFVTGSILNMPFEDNSIESLSSLCVVEHIGLGRYGDEIDPFGSEKAIKELHRILKKGGILLFTLPVDCINKIYFNAHRAFSRNYILELLEGFDILEEKYHYGKKLYDHYDEDKGFGTGYYLLKKK